MPILVNFNDSSGHHLSKASMSLLAIAFSKVSMPILAIAFSKVSMHRREIGLAHSSLPCHHDTPHLPHVLCIYVRTFHFHCHWPYLASLSHVIDSDLLDPLLDQHLDSKWFFPPQWWQIFPKAGHSPLLWECPQYLQSVYWGLPLKFVDLFLNSSILTRPGFAIPSIFLWANFDSIFLAS